MCLFFFSMNLRSSDYWFYHLDDPKDSQPDYTKEEILKIIKKIKLPSPFYVMLDAYIDTIEANNYKKISRKELIDFIKKEIFSGVNYLKYQYKVNFNRMTGRGSFSWLYKNFLCIYVVNKFQTKGNDKWKFFDDFVKKRHKIVHNYSIDINKNDVSNGKNIAHEIIDFIQNELNSIGYYSDYYN